MYWLEHPLFRPRDFPRTSASDISRASGNLLVARDVHCTTQYIPPLDSLRIQYWAIMRIFVLGVGGAKNIFRIIVTIISLLDSLFPSQTVIFIESQGWPPSSCLLEVENHQLPKNLKSFRFLKPSTSC